jgi:hypothetical protein
VEVCKQAATNRKQPHIQTYKKAMEDGVKKGIGEQAAPNLLARAVMRAVALAACPRNPRFVCER